MQFNFALPRFTPDIVLRAQNMLFDKSGDEYGSKAVILILVVVVGIAAWQAFGTKVTAMIKTATSGM